mmetsp:Transcript_81397/g.220779  ORF Transcript_81397/g.220779 Transcript_81397/m.220779 type:complete len:279 (-) Transcript_81397:69-905(-)
MHLDRSVRGACRRPPLRRGRAEVGVEPEREADERNRHAQQSDDLQREREVASASGRRRGRALRAWLRRRRRAPLRGMERETESGALPVAQGGTHGPEIADSEVVRRQQVEVQHAMRLGRHYRRCSWAEALQTRTTEGTINRKRTFPDAMIARHGPAHQQVAASCRAQPCEHHLLHGRGAFRGASPALARPWPPPNHRQPHRAGRPQGQPPPARSSTAAVHAQAQHRRQCAPCTSIRNSGTAAPPRPRQPRSQQGRVLRPPLRRPAGSRHLMARGRARN